MSNTKPCQYCGVIQLYDYWVEPHEKRCFHNPESQSCQTCDLQKTKCFWRLAPTPKNRSGYRNDCPEWAEKTA